MQTATIRDERPEHSSAITRVLHCGDVMRVHFRSGGIYDYYDISDDVVNNLLTAESPASYMVRHIMSDRRAVPVHEGAPFPPAAWD